MAFYLDNGRVVAAAGLGIGNGISKDIKLAEIPVATHVSPSTLALADAGVNLKTLLRARGAE
jgi:3-phenylpropionate/trans-cinnamate dioxygenase ferredoxin reductase subunit